MWEDFNKLIKHGVLGNFKKFEVIELFALQDGDEKSVNVFTLCVAHSEEKSFLDVGLINKDRIRLKSLKGWAFGIHRSFKEISEIESSLEVLIKEGVWCVNDNPIGVGDVSVIPKQFVPCDFLNEIAWNRVLKNNFWNGCYILELFDEKKDNLLPLLENPHCLPELSDAVAKTIPINIGSLADRLGNIVIQIPIDIMRSEFSVYNDFYCCEIIWHPNEEPRKLTAQVEVVNDNTVLSFGSIDIMNEKMPICINPHIGTYRGTVWDNENELILAATDEGAIVEIINMNSHSINPEPRTFNILSVTGQNEEVRVKLVGSVHGSIIGGGKSYNIHEPTRKRIYKEEKAKLAEQRKFVQYNPRENGKSAENARALGDVRDLINIYGEEGVWLWDPFLSSKDLLETVFHNKYIGSEIRCLNSVKSAIMSDYEKFLTELNSNFYSLKLEFRSSQGQHGWKFHDRFLIFPVSGAAANVWSLGTSISGLGKSHHILQQVDNGQLIYDAFLELWDSINFRENLIWKSP